MSLGLCREHHKHAKLEGGATILAIRVDANGASINFYSLFTKEKAATEFIILAAVNTINIILTTMFEKLLKIRCIDFASLIYYLHLKLGHVFIISCQDTDWRPFALFY